MSLLDDMFADFHNQGKAQEAPYLAPLKRSAYAEAIPLLKQAMNNDDGTAMAFYGALCILGHGMERDATEGVLWLRQAANRGHTISQVALGLCLANGLAVEQNEEEACYWLYAAAKSGNFIASDELCKLVTCNHSLVGKHFSEDDLIALALDMRRLLSHAAKVGGSPVTLH